MFHKGSNPKVFFKDNLGIDLDRLTVRDAIAFDLVKLDEDSISNDNEYTWKEHQLYSPMEYERYLLHRNFRVNLVNLEEEWSQITYHGTKNDIGQVLRKTKRTVERMYQGIKISRTLAGYFNTLFNEGFDEDHNLKEDFDISSVYLPFTNANDMYIEVALIPNTHPSFRPISSRAYYDR